MKRISSKRRKELQNFSSLFFHLLVFICLLVFLGTKSEETDTDQNMATNAPQENVSSLDVFFASIKPVGINTNNKK